MSKKVKPLVNRLVDETQLVIGSMELGDLDAALRAVGRATIICADLHAEVARLIAQRQAENRARKKGN